MSSPFAVFLRDLRLRNHFRQHELAALLGYEQAYVSALELGTRGPSKELLDSLAARLPLSEKDEAALWVSVSQSGRRFVLPAAVPTNTYRFCHELWARIDSLHPAVIQTMRELVRLEDEITEQPRCRPGRAAPRLKEERGPEM